MPKFKEMEYSDLESEIIEPYGFIYITTNLVNGKRYIGQKQFKNTYYNKWQNYLGSGKILIKAIKKYGKDNFSRNIIAIGYTQEELNNLEIKFISDYNAVEDKNFYNIAEGGKSGNPYAGYTEKEMIEVKRKISASSTGRYSFANKTEEEMDEIKEKLSIAHKGLLVGNKNPMYGRKPYPYKTDAEIQEIHNKIGIANKGNNPLKNMSDTQVQEWKHKISKANKGRKRTNEQKIKMSLAEKGKYTGKDSSQATRVICLETEKIFDTMKQAEEYYDCPKTTISKCCRGKNKSSGELLDGTRLHWMYYEDYEKQNNIT